MTEISAELVKKLRERTGVGMGKCKEALVEAKGDIELAIANLRKAGIASAVKKESRETNEGIILVYEDRENLALIEINAETDFVVKNDQFQTFAKALAEQVATQKISSVEALLAAPYIKDHKLTVDESRAVTMQSLGENIQIKRLILVPKLANQSLGVYSHAGGKLVTVVEIDGASTEQDLAKEIAMHIAAESPDYVSHEEIPSETLNHERDIARAQIKDKPAAIIDKIVEGKMKAFFMQVCLLDQAFVKNPDLSIRQLVDAQAKKTQKPLKIKRFIRWKVGK